VLGALFALRRANELCAIRVDGASVRLVRGFAPATLVHEIEDIAERTGLRDVTLRIVVDGGVPRLVPPRGVPDGPAQMIRNAVGLHPLVQFRRRA
jgi:hypothetical protein